MNLVGELVTNKVRLEQIGMTHRLTELTETLEQMDRVTTDLQSVVMKVRMVPVSQVFNRFPRMVRDLAKELNKDINLTIEGEDTELDRTVIDEIGDPHDAFAEKLSGSWCRGILMIVRPRVAKNR